MLGVLTYLLYLLSKPNIPKGMHHLAKCHIGTLRQLRCKITQNTWIIQYRHIKSTGVTHIQCTK